MAARVRCAPPQLTRRCRAARCAARRGHPSCDAARRRRRSGRCSREVPALGRVAAIRALRDLRAVDDHVVRKAEEILVDGSAGAASLLAMAEALGDAHDAARPLAIAALRRALTPKGGVFSVLRKSAPAAPPILDVHGGDDKVRAMPFDAIETRPLDPWRVTILPGVTGLLHAAEVCGEHTCSAAS